MKLLKGEIWRPLLLPLPLLLYFVESGDQGFESNHLIVRVILVSSLPFSGETAERADGFGCTAVYIG